MLKKALSILASLALLAASIHDASAVLPNIFNTQPTGNVSASLLDSNFTFLEGQGIQSVTTTGSSNAYIATPSDAWVTGYSSYKGRGLLIVPNFTSTAAATVNVSGLGAATISKNIGGVATALASGDIKINIPVLLICDGTNFFIANPTSNFTISPTFRNGLINGDMAIAQRNTTFTGINGFATPVQTLDGWFGWTDNTASMTVSQVNGSVSVVGTQYALHVQRPNGNTSTNAHRVGQIIRQLDAQRFAGQTATLSFYARAGSDFSAASSNMLIVVGQGTGSDQGSTNYTNATWTGQTNALSTTQAITATMTRYSVTVTFLSTTNEIAVTFGFTPVGTASTNDFIDITGVQLEQGGAATGYEFLPFFTQLQRCLPYYRKTFLYATVPAQNAGVTGAASLISPAAASFGASFDFPIPMFKTPTVTTYNPSAANANWRDTTNAADRTVTVNEASTDRVVITGASGTASALNRIHYTAEAGI